MYKKMASSLLSLNPQMPDIQQVTH